MKPLIEKLPLSSNHSFVARTYRTPHFEVPWHQHIELECILFTEGEGLAFVGNHMGEFKTGDVFFLGANLPHCFQKAQDLTITSAMVVQFKADFWGAAFLQLAENMPILELFEHSSRGIKVSRRSAQQITPLILSLETAQGPERVLLLYQLLTIIAAATDHQYLSTQVIKEYNTRQKERIEAVFQYSFQHFQEAITLEDISHHAGMSIPAFCSYFKKSTKKTYTEFLNELRVGHACKLLVDTTKPVVEICFESGYNTLAHFNKQFLRLKKLTPMQYRKKFSSSETLYREVSHNNRELV